MKKLLVTTSIPETFDKNYQLVLLGQWCLENNFHHLDSKKNVQINKFHWADKLKLEKDANYLISLNDRIIKCLKSDFNTIHRTNLDLRQLRIILGAWLLHYLSVMWDRYENLRVCFDNYELDYTIELYQDNLFTPLDTAEFNYMIKLPELNNKIILEIIKFSFSDKIKFIKISNKIQTFDYSNIHKKNLRFKAFKILDKILCKFSNNYKIVFYHSYFDLLSLIKLNLKLGQLPRFFFEFKKQFNPINYNPLLRNSITSFSPKNNFEKMISNFIFKHMPQSFMENYKIINNYTEKLKINSKGIFTANAHLNNDIFNFWVAKKIKQNIKLFISQHGGALKSKYSYFEHQEKISDFMTVWHKPFHNKHYQLTANKIIKIEKFKKIIKSNSKKYLTLVTYEAPLFTYRAQSCPHGSMMKDEFDDLLSFFSSFKKDIQKNILFRTPDHSEYEGWYKTKTKLLKKIHYSQLNKFSKYRDYLKYSKLIVCKYPQTTFSEAMHSGIPTILLYNDYWGIHPFFDDIVEILKKANILFNKIPDATDHINNIWHNTENWWNAKDVVFARNSFNDQCCLFKDSWVTEWKVFLTKHTN